MHTEADFEDTLEPPIPETSFLLKKLKGSVPDVFIRDAIRALLWSYRRAGEVSGESYDGTEAHDVAGHLRRANFEGSLREAGKRHGGVVNARLNTKRTSFYSEIRFGELVFTEMSASAPGKIRRPANFRTELAKHSQTYFSFARGEKQNPSSEGSYYAILMWGHFQGRMSETKLHPDFLEIVFPNEDCTEAEERICLDEQLRHEIEALESQAAAVEKVDDLDLPFTGKTGAEIDDEEEAG